MFKITYDPWKGKTLPDCALEVNVLNHIEEEKRRAKSGKDFELAVGSELYINSFRVMVCRGLIKLDNIVFLYTDDRGNKFETYPVESGHLTDWPKGFCETMEDQIMEILDWKPKT